jgi:hypothetical protein
MGKAVEKRRFPYIRMADDGHNRFHHRAPLNVITPDTRKSENDFTQAQNLLSTLLRWRKNIRFALGKNPFSAFRGLGK